MVFVVLRTLSETRRPDLSIIALGTIYKSSRMIATQWECNKFGFGLYFRINVEKMVCILFFGESGLYQVGKFFLPPQNKVF